MTNGSKGDPDLGLALHAWGQHLDEKTQGFFHQTRRSTRSFFLYDRDVPRLHAQTFSQLAASHTRAFAQSRHGLAEIEQVPRNRILRIARDVPLVKFPEIVHYR